MRQLKEILWRHGSAVISGYGGLGKSQVMTALAERAETDGDFLGGCRWKRIDSDIAVRTANSVG